MHICVHFVDGENNIHKDFVTSIKLERVRAVDIADAIMKCLENLGLSLSSLRGQGYDGASSMGGIIKAVFKQEYRKNRLRLYIHTALDMH